MTIQIIIKVTVCRTDRWNPETTDMLKIKILSKKELHNNDRQKQLKLIGMPHLSRATAWISKI